MMTRKQIDDELLQNLDKTALHHAVKPLCRRYHLGDCNRRDFLRNVALLGVSAASAYAAIGLAPNPIASRVANNVAWAARTPKRGGVLRFGMPVQEITDPALFDWAEKSNIARLMLQYLTMTPADNVTRPYLATSWKPNRYLNRWEFTLDRRASWSNGKPLTASDVKYTYENFITEESRSSAKSLFSGLKQIEVVNDYKFIMHLKTPDLSIPENCYHYPCLIVPQGFYEEYDGDLKHPDMPVSGPYRLTEYRVGRKAVLEKRDDYWGDEGYVDAIHILDFGSDSKNGIKAMKSGQVDLVYQHGIDEIELAEKTPNIEVLSGNSTQTIVMRMQVDKPPYDNPKLRAAIITAVDNSLIKKFVYRDLAILGHNHHVSPTHPEYYKLPAPKRDVTKAKTLLAEAGYPKGITLEMTVGNTQGKFEQKAAQIVKEQLALVGIKLRLKILSQKKYWQIWDKSDFSLTYWSHRPLGTMILSLAYRSNAAWNETHYNNPRFDRALNRALAISEPKKRAQMMKRLEGYLQNDYIMIQPFFAQVFTASNVRVKNVEAHPSRYYELAWAWLED